MSGEQKEVGSRRAITKPIAIMATIGVLVAALSALNTFTGLNFRPAWGYEIEQVTSVNDQTQAQLSVIHELTQSQLLAITKVQDELNSIIYDLQQIQYELQIDMIDREKWELRKELADHKARAKGYRNNSASVPNWLQNLVDDTDTQIKKLDEERRRIERELQEYTSHLETAE